MTTTEWISRDDGTEQCVIDLLGGGALDLRVTSAKHGRRTMYTGSLAIYHPDQSGMGEDLVTKPNRSATRVKDQIMSLSVEYSRCSRDIRQIPDIPGLTWDTDDDGVEVAQFASDTDGTLRTALVWPAELAAVVRTSYDPNDPDDEFVEEELEAASVEELIQSVLNLLLRT
jgi:hypothetical protein